MFGNNVYESYMDYMYSWEHWSDRIFLSDYYEEQLYSVQSDTYVTVKSTQEGYDCIYELAQVKVKEHIFLLFQSAPVQLNILLLSVFPDDYTRLYTERLIYLLWKISAWEMTSSICGFAE